MALKRKESSHMRNLKWYHWVAFIFGGLVVVAIVYFILKSAGAMTKNASRRSKAVENEQ